MLLNSRSGKNAKKYVERKLLRRLWIFFAVFIVLAGVIVYEVSNDHLEGSACVGAIMMGMLIGAVFVRRWPKLGRFDMTRSGFFSTFCVFLTTKIR